MSAIKRKLDEINQEKYCHCLMEDRDVEKVEHNGLFGFYLSYFCNNCKKEVYYEDEYDPITAYDLEPPECFDPYNVELTDGIPL